MRRVDLSIRDVVGAGFSMLGANATASNFAKLKNCSRADLAAGIQNLVADSVAVLAVSTERQCDCNNIVFCGRAPLFGLVRKRLEAAAELFGARFLFPQDFGFATAIGAALWATGMV